MTSSNTNPPHTPPDFSQQTRPTRAQRRRAQKQKRMPRSVEGRSKLLQNLVQRAYPSYEFFIFALLCGAILGLGYLLDSQAFLVFGILMAPLMTPLVGMTLATVSGMSNFFFKTLGRIYYRHYFYLPYWRISRFCRPRLDAAHPYSNIRSLPFMVD